MLSLLPARADAQDAETRVWVPSGIGITDNLVTAVASDPADPRAALAATGRGAVYRTEDGGRTWNETFRIPFGRGVRENDGEPGTATEDPANDSAGGLDDGLSEEDLQELEDLREDIRQDVLDELTELVGEDEAERLADEESDAAVEERRAELIESGEETSAGLAGNADDDEPPQRRGAVRQIVFDPLFPGVVYLATRDGVWRSGDAGRQFVRLSAGIGQEESDTFTVAPSAGSPDRVIIGTAGGALVTDDGGLTWSNAAGEVGSVEVRALAVDPQRRQIVAAATAQGAFLSQDGGQTWRELSRGSGETSDVRAVAFVPDRALVLLGTRGGLFAVTPETEMALGVAQFASPSIRSIAIPSEDSSRFYVATARGVYESRDSGATFVELYRGLATSDVIAIDAEPGNAAGLRAATALGVYQLRPDTYSAAGGRTIGPSIRELVRAAERYGMMDGSRIAGWRRDARWARLLPRVTVQYQYDYDDNVGITGTEIRDASGNLLGVNRVPTAFTQNQNDTVRVLATWRLDQLVAGSDVFSIGSQIRSLVRLRGRRLAKVARIARERRDLAARLAGLPPDADDERIPLELRLQELTGYLDAATGGAVPSSQEKR